MTSAPISTSAPILVARDLSKVYRVYERPHDRLLELFSRRPRHRRFSALEGVSFEAPRGEGLGIIGENGAGKSTLLKILAGIVQPTSGEMRIEGKVASILELGSAFHPELTGRQNIILNAAMLGLAQREIDTKLPRIVAFSELGDFIDQPVKNYSTGMAMRLGFSIATQVDPDVLIIDEALSVGDGYFQKKCMDRLLALVEAGKTLLFCSHAMYYITAFCRRAIWLKNGRVAALGPAEDVVRRYENFLLSKGRPAADEADSTGRTGAAGDGDAEPAGRQARILAVEQPAGRIYRHGEPWKLEIEWEAESPDLQFHLGVGINRIDEVEVLAFGTHRDGLPAMTGQRRYRTTLTLPELPLVKGAFSLYIFLFDEQGLHPYDQQIIPGAFEIDTPAYSLGLIEAEHGWSLDGVAGRQPPLAAAGTGS